MKKRSASLAVLLSLALMCMTLASCDLFGLDSDDSSSSSGSGGQKVSTDNDFDNPDYTDEDDGAEVIAVKHDEEDFYGKWSAMSDKAKYLYGNVDLKINDDHTWSGNITEENFSGKWQPGNNGIVIKDTEGIIHWNLYYTSNKQVVFRDMDDNDTTPLVLKRVGN